MRFLRFGYIVPRAIGLVILYLVAEVGCGYLLQWGVVSGGSAAVGAKVDLGTAKVSLLETQLLLGQLEITNPSSPMKNLAEVGELKIDLDTAALLRKKVVVNYGILSGLEFDTDRETSGALPGDTPSGSAAPSWIAEQTQAVAANWFADLEARFQQDLRSQLESVVLAEKLAKKWPEKYEQLEQAVRKLKADAKRLEEEYKTAKTNPLRHGDFLTRLPREVTSLRDQLRALQTELAALPTELKNDKQAIELAKQHDQQRIAQFAKLDQIDPQRLTEYLLGDQVTQTVKEVAGWMRFARKMVPPSANKVDTTTLASRGTNVEFVGARPLPNVWVKHLRLEGSARLGGQPLELIGSLQDWSTSPLIVNKATTLNLKTKGGLPITLEASFDRLRATPRDEMMLQADGIAIAGTHLGDKGPVQLDVGPSTAHVLATFKLEGEALTGRLEIRQQGLGVTPDITMAKVGEPLQRSLSSRLATIREGATDVTLTGTLDDPNISIRSSLGSALAEAIAASATEVTSQYAQGMVARGQQEVDARVAQLDGELEKFRTKIEAELGESNQLVASLLGENGGSPQLGRILPGSLFK